MRAGGLEEFHVLALQSGCSRVLWREGPTVYAEMAWSPGCLSSGLPCPAICGIRWGTTLTLIVGTDSTVCVRPVQYR